MQEKRCENSENYQDYEKSKRVAIEILRLLGRSEVTYNDFELILERVQMEVDLFTFVNAEEEKGE